MTHRKAIIGFSVLGIITVASVAVAVTKSFSDVSSKDWFYQDVQYVAENSIMNGSNGKFYPSDAVNRAQLAAVIHRVDAARISNILTELNGMRLHDVDKLKGSSWQTYTSERLRYPIEGITGESEGSVNYDFVKDTLVVLAKDSGDIYELLGETGGKGWYFFIKENSDLYGKRTFGPFYDDVSKLIPQVK